MKRKKFTVLALALVMIFALAGCDNGVKTPKSASDYSGTSYQSVVNEFTEAGFTNVTAKEVDDLVLDTISDEGNVSIITINGNSGFQKGDSFPKDSAVIIEYHTAQKVAVPVSSDELEAMDYLEIAQMFSDAGFSNVETETVFDIDPDTMDTDFRNEVSIEYTSNFAQGDTYAFNSKVSVVCHLPYAKYDVNIHIDFIGNLIFSKYDVNYSIDGVVDGTLPHGQDEDLSLRLKEGSYTLTFSEKGASLNSTDLTIDVADDMEAAYRLYCENDNIRIETLYIENKHAAGEGQVMAPDSASNLKYINYQETVEKLEQAGFTNIKTEAVYDIVWGFTAEGSVASVKIGITDNFNRGDVFDANVPVIVTYHMKEDDEPSESEEPPEAFSEKPIESKPPIDAPSTEPDLITPKPTASEPVTSNPPDPKPDDTLETPHSNNEGSGMSVWIPTNGGTKYHSNSSCSKMINPEQVSESEAISRGFSRCGRCW